MSQLDPEKEYVLVGDGTSGQQEASPPRIMQVRLSAALLSQMLSARGDEEQCPQILSAEGEDMCIRVRGEDHHLQQTLESSPHQLYSIAQGQKKLRLIGNVVSKLHLRQEGSGSSTSTAATKLKERKEMEEARKAEHRTVLIDAPMLGQSKSKGSAKLKLRPKGLAPSATNSPLIRSRAGTPIEGGSMPGSPILQASHLSAKTPPTQSPALPSLHSNATKPSPLGGGNAKRSVSPPDLRRRMIQILAKGPMPRRNIVQQSHHPEPEVLILLEQIADVAPLHLQPAKDSTKKFSGPINRRSSTQNHAVSTNGKNEKGPSTVYILKDAIYREVLIEGWAEYSEEEAQTVSEHAEKAFIKLKLDPQAEEWRRLHQRGRPANQFDGEATMLRQSSRRNSKYTDPTSSLSDLLDNNIDSSQDNIRPTTNKNSVYSRISKASKGKGTSASNKSKSNTATSAKAAKQAEIQDVDLIDGATKRSRTDTLSLKARKDATPANSASRRDKDASNGSGRAGTRVSSLSKANSRKDIEYTDSSNDEERNEDMQVDVDTSGSVNKVAVSRMAKSSSEASDGSRQRRGVGSGAAFSSEPWLDVRNHGDWKRLAERFQRVYDEYIKGRSRLQDEERMIKIELEMAQSEQASLESSKAKTMEEKKINLHSDNDLEEGEASPTCVSHTINTNADPILYHNVKWRQHTNQKEENLHISPLSIEDLAAQIRQIQELEAQLNRMKGTLKSSKKSLELIAA